MDRQLHDRKEASIVINGHEGAMTPTSIGIPQGLPVSPILFAIYISGIFDEVEAKLAGISLSFVDNISWLVIGEKVTEITEKLQRCARLSKEWASRNAIEFDIAKTEAIIFTKNKRRLNMEIGIEMTTKLNTTKAQHDG
jgi:hypothetical protein